jgi:hypothetical protein
MWIYNNNINKWNLPIDRMSRDSFDTYQQDLEEVRFYSKCLSGSVFNNISDTNDLFPILNFKSKDWAINYAYSQNNNISTKDKINNDYSLVEYYKNNLEYNFTLKGYFSSNKFISESFKNFNYVDVATLESLDLDLEYPSLVIDGIKLKENNTILVKNQFITVILDKNANPNDYFNTTYEIVMSTSTQTEYLIPDYSNGIYIYKNLKLEKQDIISYSDIINLSYSIKLGSQAGKQFILNRLKNGYFPILNGKESVLFTQSKNYLLRNQMDYNNLLDINYYDLLVDSYNNIERYLFVGEFGSILINQENYSAFIENEYKRDLTRITSVKDYYYVVGKYGTLLKLDKKYLKINKIDINCKCSENRLTSDLTDISFYNSNLGVIVGTLNTIFITEDGGNNWNKLTINSFISYNYNRILWIDESKFYVTGNNGVYIEFNKNDNNWIPKQKRISKKIDDEEYILTENIYDLLRITINNWNPEFSYDDDLSTLTNKDLIILTCSNGTIIIQDLNNSIPEHEFIYLELNNNYGDIKSIIRKDNKFYFTGTNNSTLDTGIFSFDIQHFNLIGQDDDFSNVSIYKENIIYESELYPNKLYNKNNTNLVISGNNSLTKISLFTASLNFSEIDQSLANRLKSKLLFLNYEIASKLNFFTDDGVYRMPKGINFDLNIGSSLELKSKINELSWIDYWKDSHLTFKYYEQNVLNNSNKVLFNSIFKYSAINTSNIVNSINIDKDEVKKLAPTIEDDSNSLYEKINGINIIFPNSNSLYLYSYIMIYRVSLSYPVEIGDVFRLESSILESNFIANNIFTNGNSKYIYFYTNFNQNIITDIKKEGSIKITNLNYYTSITQLENRFNNHYIGFGYKMSVLDNNLQLDPIFNSFTAYYNLSCQFISNQSFVLNYENSFLKFGYTPNYNILDYLSNLDNQYFTPNKEYLSLPIYKNLPYSQTTIYIDIISGNKLYIKNLLKFVWDTVLVNTFVDIYINGNLKTSRLFVTDKYLDSNTNSYIIVFNKKINGYNNTISTIDIVSRRKLEEISYDLSELNTIQTIDKKVEINNNSFDTFDLNIKSRFYTDSYAKVLLADKLTKEKISGLIYTDSNGILSINITFLHDNQQLNIVNISNLNNHLVLTTDKPHSLETGSIINLDLVNNDNLNGFHIVEKINNTQIKINISYSSSFSANGKIDYNIRDPFLNYRPIDLIDIGVDKKGKIAIELKENNTLIDDNIYKLNNVDYNKLRYRLIDGLDIITLSTNYPWILEAEISNAIIGQDSDGLVWYKGLWECGRWFRGKWISGTWINGDWYGGVWMSNIIKDNYINVEYDKNNSTERNSYWVNGRWFGGDWLNGTWFNGRWYGGKWNNGNWYNGIWNNGDWFNGTFSGGIWVNGIWKNGIFNSFSFNSYWLDGEWTGGDFENGMWFNGIFNQKNKESRFGTKSDNSRVAIWQSGEWFDGSFHSRLNIIDNKYDVSISHRYSMWKSGNWYNGSFYGGVVFNINFKSGIWYGGILEEISLIGTKIEDNKIYLDGIYYFNIGYEFYIIGIAKLEQYSILGTNINPIKYKTLKVDKILDKNITIIYVDKSININITSPTYTGLKIVSYYKGSNWKSGIWSNGIFENGMFEGGMWLNGIFDGEWT